MKKLFGSREKSWTAQANAFARHEQAIRPDKAGNRAYELDIKLKPTKATGELPGLRAPEKNG